MTSIESSLLLTAHLRTLQPIQPIEHTAETIFLHHSKLPASAWLFENCINRLRETPFRQQSVTLSYRLFYSTNTIVKQAYRVDDAASPCVTLILQRSLLQPSSCLILANQRKQFAHVGAVVHAGEGLAEREEQGLALAAGGFFQSAGQCVPRVVAPA